MTMRRWAYVSETTHETASCTLKGGRGTSCTISESYKVSFRPGWQLEDSEKVVSARGVFFGRKKKSYIPPRLLFFQKTIFQRTYFSELGNLQVCFSEFAEQRIPTGWSESCLSVFFFFWGLGVGWVLPFVSFPIASRVIGPVAICRARSGVLVRRRHGHGAASCASGGGRAMCRPNLSRRCVAAIFFFSETYFLSYFEPTFRKTGNIFAS